MLLYHAGFKIIKEPDIHYGRKNADFGQGFYLTAEKEFAYRWAQERKGEETIVNTYELDMTNLKIRRFIRDKEWFEYIFANRNRKPDTLEADVIMGPIANDIIYNTNGIFTGGILEPEQALKLLLIGPEYTQIVLKTKKAAVQLKWLESAVLTHEEINGYRKVLIDEEADYQIALAKELDKILEE